MIKRILSAAISIVAAYFVLKILWWVIRNSFLIALSVFELVVLIVIAVPIYIIVSRKLFR